MDASKDYYAILGVLPSIEPTALKAVYLALVKKYHPDVYKGNNADAERITKQLNEAYGVLGDEKKRAEYDALRKNQSSQSGDFSQENTSEGNDSFDSELERDWNFIVEYYPEAETCRKELEAIARSLSVSFQYIILTEKLSEQSKKVTDLLKSEYLKRYFGSNEKIQKFAFKMLLQKRRDVALELNNIIRIVGNPSDNKILSIIMNISNKFNLKIDYKKEIVSIFITHSTINNGRYYGLMIDGRIIGSIDNSKYFIFNDIDHYREKTTKFVKYWSTDNLDTKTKFFEILDKQNIIEFYT